MITIREKDIEVFTMASSGFKGFYDENNKRVFDISEYWHNEAMEFLARFNKVKTVEDIKKAIPNNIGYSLDIIDNELILSWSVNEHVYGMMIWNFEIVYGAIQ